MDTRTNIIKQALILFNEKGYEKTNISDIMKVTKLSKGGMYHHFDSKETILVAVIEYAYTLSEKIFYQEFNRKKKLVDKIMMLMNNDIIIQNEYLLSFSNLLQQDSIILRYHLDIINQKNVLPYIKDIIEEGNISGEFTSTNTLYDSYLLYHISARLIMNQTNNDTSIDEEVSGFLNTLKRVFNPSYDIINTIELFLSEKYLKKEVL